jgi:flagellar protein FlgJ
MLHLTRRLLTGPLLVAAIGAGLVVAPAAANAAAVTDAVQVGGALRAGATTSQAAAYRIGTVRSASGAVNLRAGASTASAVKGRLASGTRMYLVCAVAGQTVAGTVRTSMQWDRLTNGAYISHAYVIVPALPLCNGAPVRAPAPVLTPEQFIRAAVPGAQLDWRTHGVPPSVTIAQAILESGWGRSKLSVNDRNYFGIKCQNGRYGRIANGCHTYVTQECTKAGKCFTTTGVFRTYASMARSFRDHGEFLRVNSRYRPAFAYTRSANRFIWSVWKAGYATDPNYFTKVTGIMAKYRLYQYDTWK